MRSGKSCRISASADGRGQAVARCGVAYAVGRPWSVVGCRWIWYWAIVDCLLTTRYCLRATGGRPEGVRPLFAAAGARRAEDGGRRAAIGRGQAVNRYCGSQEDGGRRGGRGSAASGTAST